LILNQLLDNLKIITVIAVLLLSPFLVNQAFAELTFDSVVKSADETVNNSITFQNDDELFFTCNANKTYSVLLNLFLSSDGGAGFKTQWTLPTGATGSISAGQLNSGVSQLTQDITISDSHLVSGTDQKILTFYGKIKTSSTSGVCQLQWSQNSQTVANTIVEEGSLLRVYEIGATQTVIPTGDGTGSVIFVKVVKSVDETVNNSNVFQDDDELKFACNANKAYAVYLTTFVDGVTTAEMKTKWTLPIGATGEISLDDLSSGDIAKDAQDITTSDFKDLSGFFSQVLTYVARINMGSTAGTCQFQWTQFVATVGDTKVLAGSSLIVYEEGADSGTDSIGLLHTKVVKSVDETIFNLNVLQDDDELFFICEANTVYIGRLSLFTEITFTADWKEAWTIPTGATAFVLDDVMRFSDSQTMRDATVSHFQNGGLLTQPQNTAGDVLFNIGSTTGICQFQWSQFNSEASDARMKAGSTLLVYEQGTSTVSDLQGEKGEKGDKGDTGDTGATGSAGTGGGGQGAVGSPVAPAPALSETELVELVLAQLTPVEPTIFTPIVEPLESIVQTFFEFAVVDTSLDQLVLNSFVQNERLGIRWSSGQDIVILSAIPATSPFQITFEAFPVAKQGSGAVISTDFLSYNLQVPSVQCSLQITTNCVEKVRYEIPVTINAVIGDSQVSDTGTITVDLVDEFLDPILLILLATFAIPIIGIIIQKSRGRKSSVPARRVFQ